jgi:hypothetical protein
MSYERHITQVSDSIISAKVVCKDGVFNVSGAVHAGARDKVELQYRAPEPCDMRLSISGSALPFPNSDHAFGSTNSGVAKLDDYGNFSFNVLHPNSYYKNDDIAKHVGQGKILIQPILYLIVNLAETKKMYEIDLGSGVPLRTLTNHPQKLIRSTGRNTAPYFY